MKKIKILLLLANAVIALLIFVSIYDDDEPRGESRRMSLNFYPPCISFPYPNR